MDPAAGFCEHINEPPKYSCLTVRASQSFETPKTTHATKQRHVIEDLSNVAFRTSYVTTSGLNENWIFWPCELPAASQDRLCFVGLVNAYPYE